MKKLTDEIKDWVSAEKERFLKMVGERRVKTTKKYSELSKKELFSRMKKNGILDDLENINSAEDLKKIVNKYKYEEPLLEWWAIFVKWDADGATKILERFEEMWWIYTKNKNPNILTYESPDRKWKINLRNISSSEEKVEKAWYKVESTLDVMWFKNGKKEKKEIKFILLK